MAAVDEVQKAVGQFAKTVGASVVRIGRGPGRGGGVVIGDGTVVTNAHNILGSEVTVTFADGRRERGSVAGVDVDNDLAVVRVDAGESSPLVWREAQVELGMRVFTVTTPASADVRITVGTISALGRRFRGPRGRLITGGLEHTAPLGRGSSGSPIVDAEGRLVGINTHRIGEGFYLAMSADAELRRRVDALARGESPRRLYLGLALLPPHAGRRLRASVGLPERDGLLVRAIDEDGPAARAGVRAGDLIAEAGGAALGSQDSLFEVLGRLENGEVLALRVVRGVEELEIRVTFEQGPSGHS